MNKTDMHDDRSELEAKYVDAVRTYARHTLVSNFCLEPVPSPSVITGEPEPGTVIADQDAPYNDPKYWSGRLSNTGWAAPLDLPVIVPNVKSYDKCMTALAEKLLAVTSSDYQPEDDPRRGPGKPRLLTPRVSEWDRWRYVDHRNWRGRICLYYREYRLPDPDWPYRLSNPIEAFAANLFVSLSDRDDAVVGRGTFVEYALRMIYSSTRLVDEYSFCYRLLEYEREEGEPLDFHRDAWGPWPPVVVNV